MEEEGVEKGGEKSSILVGGKRVGPGPATGYTHGTLVRNHTPSSVMSMAVRPPSEETLDLRAPLQSAHSSPVTVAVITANVRRCVHQASEVTDCPSLTWCDTNVGQVKRRTPRRDHTATVPRAHHSELATKRSSQVGVVQLVLEAFQNIGDV